MLDTPAHEGVERGRAAVQGGHGVPQRRADGDGGGAGLRSEPANDAFGAGSLRAGGHGGDGRPVTLFDLEHNDLWLEGCGAKPESDGWLPGEPGRIRPPVDDLVDQICKGALNLTSAQAKVAPQHLPHVDIHHRGQLGQLPPSLCSGQLNKEGGEDSVHPPLVELATGLHTL